jgi:DMSO/TMAO reductase YedYZ heme-binding membrane subunit
MEHHTQAMATNGPTTRQDIARWIVGVLERGDRFRVLSRSIGQRTIGQRVALAVAAALPGAVGALWLGFAVGLIDRTRTVEWSLALSEVPGMFILAATLWCTPLSRLTGRSFRTQRKWFGLSFAVLAVSNLAAFLVEHPLREMARLFAIAGLIAVAASLPLAATSTANIIKRLGYRRWKRLHRLTYLVAVAVVIHLWLVPQDDGPGGNIVATVVFSLALLLRLPWATRTIHALRTRVDQRSLLSLRSWLVPAP